MAIGRSEFRRTSITLWTTYDFTIGGIHGFRVGAGLSYNSMTSCSTANNVWIPNSTVIDIMLGYHAAHSDAELGIKNTANVEYFNTAQSAGGYVGRPPSITVGSPGTTDG